ncbi:MAG: HU family DNA-binding protein [Marmoricola sp.]
MIDTITREVVKGEKVAITGFGSWEKKIREARWVRNPATGDKMKGKKKAVPKFTVGAELKKFVSGEKKAWQADSRWWRKACSCQEGCSCEGIGSGQEGSG